MQARLPGLRESTGYGASYNREIDAWVIYWMPGAVPLGVAVSGFDRRDVAEHLIAALQMTINGREPVAAASVSRMIELGEEIESGGGQMGERYDPRHAPGAMPADVCEFGVVDLDQGKEICRAWTADGARRIANALNAAEGRKLETISSCLRSDSEEGDNG